MRYLHNLKTHLLLWGVLLLASCGSHPNSVTEGNLKIKADVSTTTLYYNGTIKPIKTYPVPNIQADGTVIEKYFEYGDVVKKGQVLFVIGSQQLAKNYQDALSAYAKAQKNYTDSQFQMSGAEALIRLKIMSKQDYLNTKTQLFNAELDRSQAKRQLEAILKDVGVSASNIPLEAVQRALASAPNKVKILAPATGIALLPENTGSKENGNAELIIGSAVKSGQNLLSIGDMSGISVATKVTEIYVDKIKVGQKAVVTGEAFPGQELHGKVIHVDRQASADSQGGIPSFALIVNIPQLTREQMDKILVGMSANIMLVLESKGVIKIPQKAVFIKNGQTWVKKKDIKSGKMTAAVVTTGRTDMDTVEISDGLKEGDEVMQDATTH